MSAKKTRQLTRKQEKLVEGIIAGKSGAQAARDAGYSPDKPENARQSAYQALKEIAGRVREVMDGRGLTLELLIDKHLRSVLEARETKFFPWRKTTKRKTEQIIDEREVVNLMVKATGLDIAFRLRGDYAPKQIEFDPDAGVPVKVINIGGVVRYND